MLDPVTFLAVFFVVWWICLFIVLPFGVRNQVDTGVVVPGTEPGAPASPKLWQRVLYTTLLAIPVTLLLLWALTADWLQRYWN
jgi:predicted secreted protein